MLSTEQQILNAIKANIYWKDLRGIYLGCNINMAKEFGYFDVNEIIGKSDYELLWKNNANQIVQNDNIVIREGRSITFEEKAVDKFGQIKIFKTSKSPLIDEDKKIIGIIGVSIDISDEKAKEEELAKSKIEIKDLLKIKNTMMANIAHEIRTPVFVLKSMATEYETTINLENSKKYLKNIKECTEYLNETIDDIFDVSRINNKTANLEITRENIVDILENIILDTAKLDITKTNPDINLISEYKEIYVDLDLKRIKIVFKNIINNAIKYTDNNSPISIHVYTKDDCIKILFKDGGMGVPEEQLNLMFEPFLVTSNSHKHGMGLGLSLCKEIISAHQGVISSNNNIEEAGITISVTLQKKYKKKMNKLIKNVGIDQIYPIHIDSNLLEKSHCILGISPFNSFFSEENITTLINWANTQFRSFQIFIPDKISYYTR
ncbi:MAG: tRNA-dependent cyclodipeptide synthase [Rickettsiales bacterium]|nr:tRNA-dependent cyclodipeptide synthase [Rickettsiales bacterium]